MKIPHPITAALLLIFASVMAFIPVLTIAPNRVMAARGVVLADLGWTSMPLYFWMAAAIIVLGLIASVWIRKTWRDWAVVVVCAVLMGMMLMLAGSWAHQQSVQMGALVRVSFGGAFWFDFFVLWFIGVEAMMHRVAQAAWRSFWAVVLLFLPVVVLLHSGVLASLSILKEYANNTLAFQSAWVQHLGIVGWVLLFTLLIGLPLGAWAHRAPRVGSWVLNVLGLIQTIPSIALFGALIAPLVSIGVSGVGLIPAVIALTLYSLLAIVRSVVTGLGQIPSAVIEAAQGQGLNSWQRLWWVEARLALPSFLSGLRVTLVQTVGLAVVAALIGAGGFGAIIFRGLSAGALDLVLLGVLPVVALSLVADALLKIAVVLLGQNRMHDDTV